MSYALPSTINTTKGFQEVLTYVNTVTDNWISNTLLIGIYVIILIGFYKTKEDFTGALAVAGYSTFVIALLFWLGGFVNGVAFGITIAVAVIGTLALLLDHN
jgi:hypothetical protein